MNHHIPKLTSLLKVHGGKSYLARRFVDLFPETPIYVEACAGGLNVLLARAKRPGVREIACEIDPSIYLVWKAAIQEPDRLIDCIRENTYTEYAFDYAKSFLEANDPCPRWNSKGGIVRYATQYIICNRMSRGGLMKDFAWSERLRGKRAPTGPVPGDVSAWNEFQRVGIKRTIERVKDVELIYGDCLKDCLKPLFHEYRYSKDLFKICSYIDPPYPRETRTANGIYNHEMPTLKKDAINGQTSHEDIIRFVDENSARHYFFLSSYDNSLYNSIGLNEYKFNMPNHSGQGKSKQRRVEVLYTNVSNY